MLISTTGDQLLLHSFGVMHKYSAFYSFLVLAVVVRHIATIAKIINSQGFSF